MKCDPARLDAYNKRFFANIRYHGVGVETEIEMPCPFCASPHWARTRVIATEDAMKRGATCEVCGRSARFIFDVDRPGEKTLPAGANGRRGHPGLSAADRTGAGMKIHRSMRVMFMLPIVVERGASGFTYVRSPIIPGLLVGSHEEAIAIEGVHMALRDLSNTAMAGAPVSPLGDLFARTKGAIPMSILDDLETEVARTPTVVDSAAMLLGNLTRKLAEETQALADSGADVSRLQHVLDVAQANNARIAKLITDNTSAATADETPPPVDVPALDAGATA